MTICCRVRGLGGIVTVAGLALGAAAAFAQTSSTGTAAAELAQKLEQANLDGIAADDPAGEERFVAALYFPGQLFVVTADYPAPALMAQRISNAEYRDVYIDLNSASVPESRIFIDDKRANGLERDSGNEPADSVDRAGRAVRFDGDWGAQNMSREEYDAAFAEAEEIYAGLLSLLAAKVDAGP